MLHEGISYDPIQVQGQVHGGLEFEKMADFGISPPLVIKTISEL